MTILTREVYDGLSENERKLVDVLRKNLADKLAGSGLAGQLSSEDIICRVIELHEAGLLVIETWTNDEGQQCLGLMPAISGNAVDIVDASQGEERIDVSMSEVQPREPMPGNGAHEA